MKYTVKWSMSDVFSIEVKPLMLNDNKLNCGILRYIADLCTTSFQLKYL